MSRVTTSEDLPTSASRKENHRCINLGSSSAQSTTALDQNERTDLVVPYHLYLCLDLIGLLGMSGTKCGKIDVRVLLAIDEREGTSEHISLYSAVSQFSSPNTSHNIQYGLTNYELTDFTLQLLHYSNR